MFLVSHLSPRFTSGCALKDASMKMVVAIIRPERLPSVQMAIKIFKAELMRVTETRSCGRGEGYTLIYRSSEIRVRSSPKLRVEILTEGIDAVEVVDAIVHTGFSNGANSKNDGRIFVISLDHYRELSERGPEAAPANPR
jgi:nitrogen regulatory protein P-II 1